MARNEFNSVQVRRPRTNVFDLSHDVKLSLKAGMLCPVMCMEALPSDSFRISNEVMLRFAPLIAPVMHRFDVSVHYFFVPNRILWPNWHNFINGGESGDADPALPYFTITDENNPVGSLADHLGLPQTEGSGYRVSALPFAAYLKVYDEYYRDQNLMPTVNPSLTDGSQDGRSDSDDFFEMRYRSWQHDYFTSALPFAQKGDEVTLPIGSFNNVPVDYQQPPSPAIGGVFKPAWGDDPNWPTEQGLQPWELDASNEPLAEQMAKPVMQVSGSQGQYLNYDPQGTLTARTSELEAEAASINNLRRAFRLQEWLEKNARGGTRYTESIQVHFGVRPQDSRLQRPEYIGGSKQPVSVSEVLNTAGGDSEGARPQGDMAGHAISVGAGRQAKYYCQEHGYIIGIMSVMPKPAYQQGVPRHFLKDDRFMYAWPTFAHIGEQEILNQELYVDHSERNGTFGYTPRYSEYRFHNSWIAGDFKTTLNFWHAGRLFENDPALNQEFVEVSPDEIDRIFAVQDGTDYLWCHVFHRVTAKRPLPRFGTPTL